MFIWSVPATSFTMYMISPICFVDGSGRVNVVFWATVMATISSFAVIVYVVAVTGVLVFVGAKLRFPDPSVINTVFSVGATDGNVYPPSWIFPVDEVIDKDDSDAILVTFIDPIYTVPGMSTVSM